VGAAWSWFAAHVLGGLLTAVMVGGGHLLLQRRHLAAVTERQTAHFDAKTDAQTQALKGDSEGSGM
jgi:hypothetical protein